MTYQNNVFQIFNGKVQKEKEGVLSAFGRDLAVSERNTLQAIDEPETRKECQKVFRELLIEWRKFHYLSLAPTTKMLYDKKIRFFKPLEKLEVKSLTAREIDQLIGIWSDEAKSDEKRRGRQHFHQELSMLRGILNYYKRRMNPEFQNPVLSEHFKASVIRQGVKRENQCLTPQELKLFFEALKKHCQKKTYYLALTQFSLGLRVGEAVALKWEKLDLKKRLARIDETMYWCGKTGRAIGTKRPKNTQERILVMPVNLVMDLLEFEEDKAKRKGLLFHHNGKPLQMRSVLKSYQIGLRRAGINHLSGTHILRRTAATLANAMTGDLYAVSSLLGHSDPKVTLKYVTPTIRHKERVAGTLDDVLSENFGKLKS